VPASRSVTHCPNRAGIQSCTRKNSRTSMAPEANIRALPGMTSSKAQLWLPKPTKNLPSSWATDLLQQPASIPHLRNGSRIIASPSDRRLCGAPRNRAIHLWSEPLHRESEPHGTIRGAFRYLLPSNGPVPPPPFARLSTHTAPHTCCFVEVTLLILAYLIWLDRGADRRCL
jgi:hypothetical protein